MPQSPISLKGALPLALAVALGTGQGALALSAFAQANDRADTIVYSQVQEPDQLNPVVSDMMATIDATAPIIEGLVQIDDHGRAVPQLALAVPSVENGGVKREGQGMVVTYHLRPHVKWHDGQPFTAEDVKFTWQAVMHPKTTAASREGWSLITAVDVVDPLTARVHFKAAYAPFALAVFTAILPAHLLARDLVDPGGDSINHDAYNLHPIGTGPFKFKSWVPGDHITMARFDDYYLGRPKLAGLVMKIVPDAEQALALLQAGDLDLFQGANADQSTRLAALPGVLVSNTVSMTYEHLDFNLTRPFFQDRNVRQALAFAIDRGRISREVYRGLYPIAYSDLPPGVLGYNKDLEGLFAYDPAKARQLLDQAGWKVGPDGVRTKAGKRFSVHVMTTAGHPLRQATEAILLEEFKQVGVELVVDDVPGALLFGPYPDGLLKDARFDLALYALSSAPDPDSMVAVWDSGHVASAVADGQNACHYSNPEVDRLLKQGATELDAAKRGALYRSAEAIVTRDAPAINLLRWGQLDAHHRRLLNFKPNATSAGNLWNTWEWAVR